MRVRNILRYVKIFRINHLLQRMTDKNFNKKRN